MTPTLIVDKITKGVNIEPVTISASSCDAYLTVSIVIPDWTVSMYYELPSISVLISTKQNSVDSRFPFTKIVKFDELVFSGGSVSYHLRNIPQEFDIKVIPNFDNDAIKSHNELIKNGIEDGELFEPETEFLVSVSVIS